MSDSITTCRRCGASLSPEMRFCPSCGKGLEGNPLINGSLGIKQYGALLSGALLLFGVGVGTQSYVYWKRGVEKPVKELEAPKQAPKAHHADVVNDPELVSLRKQMESRPGDLNLMKALAGAIGSRLRSNPEASQALALEAIDLLSTILALSPDEPEALLLMADVSFDQKAFSKALEFYERYLKLRSEDLGARSRYASAMTFVGRYDDSIKELDRVLKADPKNFPAMAYLAITWAQKGDLNKAKEVGVTALDIAPSDEARARFASFVSGLDQVRVEAKAGASTGVSTQSGNVSTDGSGVEQLVAFVKANPIAGPKFSSHDFSGDTLTLYFKDFPMQAMPPFAKEKFFGGIRSKAAEVTNGQVKRIVFSDATSKAPMETLAF